MSYRKKYIVDGGCPKSGTERIKVISMRLDKFENEPVYTQTIRCSSCAGFFRCVFNHDPCIIYKCVKYKFDWLPMRDSGNELQLAVPERFSNVVIRAIEYGIGVTQKKR